MPQHQDHMDLDFWQRPPDVVNKFLKTGEHSDFVRTVAQATQSQLRKIGERPPLPAVILTPALKLVKYDPPPESIAPMTMIPACIDMISPNECQQYFGGSGLGGEQNAGGTLGAFGAGGGPFNLPGMGRASNVFLPAMGSLLVMAGKTVAGILATEGATELLNAVLKRYNVPWIRFRFRSGRQNGKPFGGAAHAKHGLPASRWTGDPDAWAQ